MKILKKILIIIGLFLFTSNFTIAEIPHYVDFKFILNESSAGKNAQNFLKKKLSDGIKKIQDKEKNIQKEEVKIIQQKKIISAEEYKKKVSELRNKVALLQKERDTLLDSVAKQRAKARKELLTNLNPIMEQYMKDKKIRMVLNKNSLLLADENLDITKDIVKILNSKIKSIKLN